MFLESSKSTRVTSEGPEHIVDFPSKKFFFRFIIKSSFVSFRVLRAKTLLILDCHLSFHRTGDTNPMATKGSPRNPFIEGTRKRKNEPSGSSCQLNPLIPVTLFTQERSEDTNRRSTRRVKHLVLQTSQNRILFV